MYSPIAAKSSLDLRYPSSPSSAHTPIVHSGSSPLAHGGYSDGRGSIYGAASGDLRAASRRAWSKSADDLRAQPGEPRATMPIRVDTQLSFVDKIAAYRGRADSASGIGDCGGRLHVREHDAGHEQLYKHAADDRPAARDGDRAGTVLRKKAHGLGAEWAEYERAERQERGNEPRVDATKRAWGGRDGTPREGANGHGMRERDGSGGSPVSISISAPLLDGHGLGLAASAGMNGSGTAGYVHTRSHSFTPKLSSRLAGLGAASPGRKGSAGEVDPGVEREKEKRVVFPFHFGGGAGQTKPLPSMPGPLDTGAAPLLAPPHIILEPASPSNPHDMRNSSLLLAPSTDANDSKRASQIVYAAGFAFKMEVRGTKLVLHKPPGDCAAAVRELFPQGVVDDAEDEEAAATAAQEDGAGQRRDAGSVGRKKRVFWGRGRHPAIGVRGAGAAALGGVFGVEGGASLRAGVEKGTVEALVHELVFATVFLHADCAPDEEAWREEAWRDYALAVLPCLPMLARRARVETECIRCAGYLISGAVPEESESTRKRVAWMAGEHLRLHGAPADADAWEDFRAEALPDVYFPTPQPVTSGMPVSSSTQAIYAPSPLLGAGSPTLGPAPFSPRPNAGDARMVGLLDALGFRDTTASPSSATTSPHSSQPSRAGLPSRMPWAGLQTEGLSRDVLLAFDPHIIARSLAIFQPRRARAGARSSHRRIPKFRSRRSILAALRE
ncbi:hypothetical protein B0H15DRAFT_952567 [Mycena belliarum]|uniref:Uncharacterized protein n=1 Tax=Mycena belliarum TaxID=1033014 RepID=A0AAD6TWL9_9AGAR|nr:hypothetical protein B0H15DRAFT_952567 [Mycena belliae]